MINWLTAHGYHSGNSEIALKECLTSRYKREDFILTDKLTEPYFRKTFRNRNSTNSIQLC